MLKNLLVAVSIILIIISGCKDKKANHTISTEQKISQFIPVTEFISGQLHDLDTLPITPLLITSMNGHTDSVWLKKSQLRIYAAPFTESIIDSEHLYKYFKESSFLDQSINAFTYSYDPIKVLPSDFNLQRWDVYVDPQKQTIQRVYIVKAIRSKDSAGTITRQLTWKSGSSFKITDITNFKNGVSKIKEQQVSWNFNP